MNLHLQSLDKHAFAGAMATTPDINAVEAQIDAEYAARVPKHSGWELSASYLLLAHALAARQDRSHIRLVPSMAGFAGQIENRKYGLMHAVRFVSGLPSRPRSGQMVGIAADHLRWAHNYLSLGADYNSVVSAFTQYHAGLFTVEDVSDAGLKFSPVDKTELLYDLADGDVHEPEASRAPAVELTNLLSDIRSRGLTRVSSLLANKQLRTRLMQLVSSILRPIWQLPNTWSYHGINIEEMRQFWVSLLLFAHLHSTFLHDDDSEPWKSTLSMRLPDLADTLAILSELPSALVAQCIRWHVYDRNFGKSDIALTPFIDIGKDNLVTSPELLTTSRFERNFYAHVARADTRIVDRQSHLLEPEMARELSEAFRARGFRTATNISYASTLGAGDIDLLVWSPAEKAILALELKWYVQPGDFREVINRNEMAKKAITQQLSKYRAALQEELATIMGRAFPNHRAPLPVRLSTGLVMRNHVGRSALRNTGSWFAPEAALHAVTGKSASLVEIIRYLESFAWLPNLDPDAHLVWQQVFTPSGFVLTVPGIRPPADFEFTGHLEERRQRPEPRRTKGRR